MCAMEDRERGVAARGHLDLLLEVARLYYLEHRTQAEIARAVGYSRPTVSRLLDEARRRNMVRITIDRPLTQSLELERALMRRFRLGSAAVAEGDGTVTDGPARLAAAMIASIGQAHSIIALSWGRSIAAAVAAMAPQHWRYSNVVQMVGALGQPAADTVDAGELCRLLAQRIGGTHRRLPVPLVLDSARTAEAMRHEEAVVTSLELAARSDIALIGVGAVEPDGTPGEILLPFLTAPLRAQVRALGAVAHVCGHFFTAEGEHIRDPLCARTISLAPERISGISTSILTAWGAHKVPALRAALRSRLFTTLVTDEPTARELLRS